MRDPMISERSPLTASAREQRWKSQLLDLTFRNPLLNFVARSRFPLAVPGKALDELVHVLEDGKKLLLNPAPALAAVRGGKKQVTYSEANMERLDDLIFSKRLSIPLDPEKASSRLRRLQRAAQLEVQETGANNLFLAVGTLEWELNNSSYVSPLILVPVNLISARGGKFSLEIDETSYTQTNLCLVEKLSAEFNIAPSRFGSSGILDDAKKVSSFLRSVEMAMASTGAEFKVQRSVDLAILQFAKFRMWKDIEDHWGVISSNRVIQHLVRGNHRSLGNPLASTSQKSKYSLDELSESCPLPADATQLTAISKAISGDNFILEGPPGTGKSQTITNMIAASVAQGKRVLFVAEKKAALEVVKRRLSSVGLEEHILDLHDKDSRITSVRRQIRVALQRKGTGQESIDPQLSAKLSHVREDLADFKTRLHEQNPFGLSLYSAWTQKLAVNGSDVFQHSSTRTGTSLLRPEFVQKATAHEVQNVRQKLEQLTKLTPSARPARKHPWKFVQTAPLHGAMQEIISAGKRFSETLEKIEMDKHSKRTIEIAEGLAETSNHEALGTLLGAGLSAAVLDEVSTSEWQRSAARLLEDFQYLDKADTPIGRVFTNEILTRDIEAVALKAEQAARQGFLSFGRKKRIHEVVVSLGAAWIGLPKDEINLPTALRMIQTLEAQRMSLYQHVETLPGLEISADEFLIDQQGLEKISQRIAAVKRFGQLWQELKEGLAYKVVWDIESLLAAAGDQSSTAQLIEEYIHFRRALMGLFPRELENELASQNSISLADYWTDTDWPRRLDEYAESDITAWAKFQALVGSLSSTFSDDAMRGLLSGRRKAEDILSVFDRELMNRMVQERLVASKLSTFDTGKHERLVSEYVALAKAKRAQARLEIPQTIIERREGYKAQDPAKLKELREAIKPAGPRARELMTNYFESILKVTPCILASPDSVARYIPVKRDMFDIVIFDEASQIRVADSLGAMGRAKSVIVVGDSQQMPPTAAFATSSSSEFEMGSDSSLADEESILQECEQAGIERVWLSGHYRSQTESLIAFSNQHFYENRLVTFPAPRRRVNGKEENGYGIRLVRVDGHFYRSSEDDVPQHLKRTNPIEAEQIVGYIEELFKKSPDAFPSLGVITFNVQQRDLIEDMVRQSVDYRLEDALDSEDGLFVKNLENVQGDERDTILFSTAFSPNEHGVLPLNFGPLNNVGGERRLNVAVTRARKEVVVFSSFGPEQLRAHETESLGIKRLKDYLELAQKGVQVLERSQVTAQRHDRHRESIALALRSRGLYVETAVGLSQFKIDLVVSTKKNPGVPLVAVMLDGHEWAARRTVGDREMLPQEILEGVLKWPSTMRVWLPEWIANPANVCNRILSRVHNAERAL